MGTNPGWTYGYVPTQGEWMAAFTAKQDDLGYTPVNRNGDTMTGRLVTFASSASDAGFNVFPGVAPSAPVDGDVWLTAVGLFYQSNGTTIGPVGKIAGGSSTDNAIARFDGIGGELQNSGVIINDTNDVSGIRNFTVSGSVTLTPSNANIVLSPTGTGTVTIAPATTGSITNMDIVAAAFTAVNTNIFTGFLTGLVGSNHAGDLTNDIAITAGAARNAADTFTMILAAGLIKQLDAAWALGTNAGMRATGVAIADTTYHIFLIRRPDNNDVDIAADTSPVGANIAANTNVNYTQLRRIFSIIRAGGAIAGFTQQADKFIRNVQSLDYNQTNPGTTAVTVTLAGVPNGIIVEAQVTLTMQDSTAATSSVGWLSALTQTDAVPALASPASLVLTNTAGAQSLSAGAFPVFTDTSRQARWRQSTSSVDHITNIMTNGWVDTRGRI